jgi:hypothetical protein
VYVERSLAALSIRLDGAGRVAADSLVAADASAQWDTRNNWTLTHVLAINRLTAADELLAAGDTARAARLLLWHEANLIGDILVTQVFAPVAYSKLARIEAARGQPAAALEHYEQFLRRYDMPVTNLQPLVDQARAAVAVLSPAKGARP